MTQDKNHRPPTKLVEDLVAGLLEQESELGLEGSRVLHLLHAAGYHDCEDVYRSSLIHWPDNDDDGPFKH